MLGCRSLLALQSFFSQIRPYKVKLHKGHHQNLICLDIFSDLFPAQCAPLTLWDSCLELTAYGGALVLVDA